MIFFILFLFWTTFWSFSTVLIERWHSRTPGILMGRSACPKCHTTLSGISLIPLFSYLFQRWRCRTCHTSISSFYPIAEATMGVIFMIIGYFILMNWWWLLEIRSIILFILWFITGLYALYDARYMEVPDKALIPAIYGYTALILLSIFLGYDGLLFDQESYIWDRDFLIDHFLWALLFYTFFYIQILLPGGFYLLKKGRYRSFFELFFGYFLFPFSLIRELWSKTEVPHDEEIPTWVGWGDLRVGLFIGLTLGITHGIFAFFTAYITGSIIGILLIALRRRKKENDNSQIPFWPFLAFGWCMAILFYGDILTFILR